MPFGSLKDFVPKSSNGGHDDKAPPPPPPTQLIPYVLAWNLTDPSKVGFVPVESIKELKIKRSIKICSHLKFSCGVHLIAFNICMHLIYTSSMMMQDFIG
jgi:hypothetical protein